MQNVSAKNATYVVLKKDGQTLFHRQKSTSMNTEESLVQTLLRELQEELGIELAPHDAHIVHIKSRESNNGSRLDFLYTASAWQNA